MACIYRENFSKGTVPLPDLRFLFEIFKFEFQKRRRRRKKDGFQNTLSLFYIYILCNSKSSTSIGEPKVKMD
jgi:hypothetical protein